MISFSSIMITITTLSTMISTTADPGDSMVVRMETADYEQSCKAGFLIRTIFRLFFSASQSTRKGLGMQIHSKFG